MTRALPLLAAILLVSAAGPPAPANWPCMQRYVPTLAASTVWPDFVASDAWRADSEASALVSALTSRSMTLEAATERLRAWAAVHPAPQARAELFAGLVAGINEARGAAVERLRAIDRRLQTLSEANSRAVAESAALPADTPPAQREAVTDRRALVIREFDSLNRTVRYACEIPTDYETRLGQFARTLQSP